MSDNVKFSLGKVIQIFTVVMALFTIVGAAYIGYDNAKDAKERTIVLETRMTTIELDYAKFKGVMEERTKNIQENVSKIYDIVKEWQPDVVQTTFSKGI